MKAPDEIYIQPNAHDGWFEGNKPNDNFVEYIRKDAMLEWVEKELNKCVGNSSWQKFNTLQEVINKINSI